MLRVVMVSWKYVAINWITCTSYDKACLCFYNYQMYLIL